LTRLFYDEAQMDFERRVNDLLFAVEESYWQLYSAYWDYYSRESAMRQIHFALSLSQNLERAGRTTLRDVKQVEEQYQSFRAQRLQALGDGTGRPGVLEAERKLRYMTGLPEDGTRLIPSDKPTEAPFRPDFKLSVQEGLASRPELQQIRHEVQVGYLAVIREKDTLLPDLRAFGDYNVNSIGGKLIGPGETSALRNLGNNRFNDWTIGLRLDIALGYRSEHASVRQAQLQLAQKIAFLQESERNFFSSLERSYRDLFQTHELIKIQRARREAAAEQVRLRFLEYKAGREAANLLLDAQRDFADAIRDEQFAIADYNVALIDFERQKGTIMRHDNVAIVDGPLPEAAQARASAHIRERAQALSLEDLHHLIQGHEHPNPAPGDCEPPMPTGGAVPVPAILEQQRGLPELPERLPTPRIDPAAPPRP
jgi:outer membrane protein TolC